MEVAREPRLAIVGLGFGSGGQTTLHGYRLLVTSRWIGHFGLTVPMQRFVSGLGVFTVDLDRMLDSHDRSYGFTERAVGASLAAAEAHRFATVGVSGHPAVANPFTALAAVRARERGVLFEIAGAPCALDNFAQLLPIDVTRPGTVLADARDVITRERRLDPRFSLALWNAGYLALADRVRLATLLTGVWSVDWNVILFPEPDAQSYTLGQLSSWCPLIDSETLVVVPAHPFVQ